MNEDPDVAADVFYSEPIMSVASRDGWRASLPLEDVPEGTFMSLSDPEFVIMQRVWGPFNLECSSDLGINASQHPQLFKVGASGASTGLCLLPRHCIALHIYITGCA